MKYIRITKYLRHLKNDTLDQYYKSKDKYKKMNN